MTEKWRCAHGLTLLEPCEACNKEIAIETVRRHGQAVDEARRVIEQEKERAQAQ